MIDPTAPGGPTRLGDLLDTTAETITSRGPNCMVNPRCPDLPRCRLCPDSATYWRNPTDIAERDPS